MILAFQPYADWVTDFRKIFGRHRILIELDFSTVEHRSVGGEIDLSIHCFTPKKPARSAHENRRRTRPTDDVSSKKFETGIAHIN